jgi:hypothetical protein
MSANDTVQRVLDAVRTSSLLGIISTELAAAHDISINRVTAALCALTQEGCVRREKDATVGNLYRYWYVKEREEKKPRAPRVDAASGPSSTVLTFQTAGGPMSLTLAQGRSLYRELGKIFGGA